MNFKSKILCVEDSVDMCELISYVLRDFEIVNAPTISEALVKARADNFSVILIDYLLPDGTGRDLCDRIRSFDLRTPILFVTGVPDFRETDARLIGANGTLHKNNPMFVDELFQRVNELAAV